MPDVEIVDYKFKPAGSINELRDFQQGHIWKDIVKYLEFHQTGALVTLKTELDHRLVLQAQGGMEVADTVIGLIDEMIQWAEDDNLLAGDEDD